ncbi:hypothetical protein DPEC_G00033350 [Dallia pectoralis]|uniref:Uncharacterized protein n=1 Tax=Dallia pectoralis TaxID=75939 RepID=A0ACC2HCV2_DALPE|nr:hypothetical protein DPEC_G00033350 [Dallia pectoralis]
MSHTNSNIHMAPHLSLLIIFFISLRFSTDGYMHVETGGSIKIPFCYEEKYTDHVKYWCKGNTWAKCDYAARTDINISTKTWISDDIKERVLTVTITDLSPVNSGYYCFAVESNQGPDIQLNWFHLTVTSTPGLYVEKQEVTGVEGGEVTVYCYYRDPGTIKWCPVCVNNTLNETLRWDQTFLYLPKIVNAVLFLLCTIIAVMKLRANGHR